MNLDDLANNPAPRIYRLTSSEPKEGYFWESFRFSEGGHWVEGDNLFAARIRTVLSSMQPDSPQTVLLRRMRELGIKNVTEEQIGLLHMRLTVDDEHVEAVKQLVYESVPTGCKVDVVGRGEQAAG